MASTNRWTPQRAGKLGVALIATLALTFFHVAHANTSQIASANGSGGWRSNVEGTDDATVKLFKSKCANCHGIDGKGHTTAGKDAGVKDWTDGKTLKALTDDQLRTLIRDGKKGDDGKERMPSFKKLGDDKINTLIKYARSFQ